MPGYDKRVPFRQLKGKTIASINVRLAGEVDPEGLTGESDHIEFVTACGKHYLMTHELVCNEIVHIKDICGDLDDLIGSPITKASERSNTHERECDDWRQRWTFYLLGTVNGGVSIAWYGTSNGFYSEAVALYLEDGPYAPYTHTS